MDDMLTSEEIVVNSVRGMNYVRPPTLDFVTVKDTKNYTEYEIFTKNLSKKKEGDNPFTNYVDSFIYCNDTIHIKQPKKSYMIKNGKKKFAYAVGMFPNPKTTKASYLDGCILAALGLKRQKTNADIICFITHDISEDDKKKLEVVFDKVMYVPYISPYDMGGHGKLKTILMDPKLFDNCPGYSKLHPYSHVFFKLHIFNPKLFPYEKVCFVDSDLVPMNYYDSLFMLDCPAGFVEYRKKVPYLESFHWDRCDFLEHGKPIPKELTDIDKPSGADVNAGLLLVEPNKKEYDAMIKELTSPLDTWMGLDKYHKGFFSFNFDKPDGKEFIENSYCYPEQNYLTKRFSGKWKYIEFAFQSWALDPCNSFGIHMAAFNPKPWIKQPCGTELKIDEKYQPYLKQWDKKNIRIPIAVKDDTGENYDNISFSYEMFNEVIVWGLVNYPKLKDFFCHDIQIHGTKVSFDRDVFKKLIGKIQFKYLKNIKKGTKLYNKLSLSQRHISDLINNYDTMSKELKGNYLQVCRKKVKTKGKYDYDFKIINYPDHQDKKSKIKKELLDQNKLPFSKFKGKFIKDLTEKQILYLINTVAYKKDKLIRDKIIKFHSKLIKKLNKNKKLTFNGLDLTSDTIKSGGKYTRKKKKKEKRTRKRKRKNEKRTRKIKKKNKLYFFTMNGCPYCTEFDPIWDEFTSKYHKYIDMEKIERSENPSLLKKFKITSFPTIILEKKELVQFEDERSVDSLYQFLKDNKII